MNNENKNLIDEIIKLEWDQFDKVQNEGGRASCQDDFSTFNIMRSSQFMEWDRMTLENYKNDLINANNEGWNLLTEKYARMMKSTDKEAYDKIKDRLPKRSIPRIEKQEEIIKIHVKWREEVEKKYPVYVSGGRLARSSDDTKYSTSSETYLRGELSTYSDITIASYYNMIQDKLKNNINMVYNIYENQVKQYGYKSLDEVEIKLKQNG